MNIIQNIRQFPFQIKQPLSCDWCIPASIEVVTKYHRPSSVKDQHDIAMMFHAKGLGLGLAQTKAALKGDFDWVHVCYVDTLHTFDELAKRVEECVQGSTPPIVSIPVGPKEQHLWHMLVPVGYDQTFFRVYNPAPNVMGDYCDLKRSLMEDMLRERKGPENTATDMLILSELPKAIF